MLQPLYLTRANGFYKIPLFEKIGLRAVFTSCDVDMSFESAHRKAAYCKMGVDPSRLVCPSQVHGDNVLLAGREHKGRGVYSRATAIQETDALVTRERLLPLAIQTADCLPVFLFDTDKRAIALIHAGWKGLHKNIIAKTVHLMEERFATRGEDLIAALGPALRPCCYEVGPEFPEFFPSSVHKRNHGLYFDIIAEAAGQLLKAGVSPGRVYDSGMCTACLKEEFFSYRRQGASAGRSMSIFEIMR